MNKSSFYTVLTILKKSPLISNLTLACCVALLGACGQKGPLYLPVKPIQTSTTEMNPPPVIDAAKATK
jgi:predicted small lipoprotein YifL